MKKINFYRKIYLLTKKHHIWMKIGVCTHVLMTVAHIGTLFLHYSSLDKHSYLESLLETMLESYAESYSKLIISPQERSYDQQRTSYIHKC